MRVHVDIVLDTDDAVIEGTWLSSTTETRGHPLRCAT
jgi:hypothetical protein